MLTWALENYSWDVYVDQVGNIATKSGNDRLAQDVASSVRVFRGELPMDVERGVEYNKPDTNRQELNDQMNEQVRLIEGVQNSVVVFDEFQDRELKTRIYVTNEENEQIVVGE